MRITGLFVAAASAALLAGCGIGAPAYPQFGESAYRIEGNTASPDANGASTHTVIYRDGPKMRVEAMLPQYGQATIVFDQATGSAYVLNPTAGAGTTATTTTVTSATTATPLTQEEGRAGVNPAPPPTAPTPGGATTTTTTTGAPAAAPAAVTGVAVQIADVDAPQPLEAAWEALGADNAKSIGECEVAGESGHEWQPREATEGVERTACITDDGIVLRVTENGRALWEATSLQRGEQDQALFGVPAGYQLINPQAVAEQVGEQMQHLDSVTGAPPVAPATQPPTQRPPG